MNRTCADPLFRWNGCSWSACVHCGRVAWDHEQSDPLADIRNLIEAIRLGRSSAEFPPVMRPPCEH